MEDLPINVAYVAQAASRHAHARMAFSIFAAGGDEPRRVRWPLNMYIGLSAPSRRVAWA